MAERKPIKTIIAAAVILTLWALIAATGMFSSYVFPGPGKVWQAFLNMLSTGELIKNTAASLGRVFVGFILSFVLAFLFGIMACLLPKAEPYYRPILEFLRHIPPMSLIPLLILWFGIGETSKIIIIILTAFFPVFMNTEAGLKGCDRKLLEVGEMLHMSPVLIFFKIRLPAALPDILTGMQIGLGYSWRAIVSAEMIAAVSGLGYMILDSQAMSRSDKVMAGIIVIGLMGLLMDRGFNIIIKKTVGERENWHVS